MSEDIRIQLALQDLDSRRAETRITAIKTLGHLGHYPAVPRLVEALCDDEEPVRAAADAALRNISGLAALPGLLNLLRDDKLKDRERIIQLAQNTLERFARQLHDGAAAKMAAAVMQVAIIERLMERSPEQVPGELKSLKELTSQASQEIRDILTSLGSVRPAR